MTLYIEVTGDDKQAMSMQIVIVDHLRAIGMDIPGRKYFDTEVRLHREFLKEQNTTVSIGVTVLD